MSNTLSFRVNEQGLEEPKPTTARELVSEIAPPEELRENTKRLGQHLLTLPLSNVECQNLINMLREYVLDAMAWAFETGFEWGVDSYPVEDKEE